MNIYELWIAWAHSFVEIATAAGALPDRIDQDGNMFLFMSPVLSNVFVPGFKSQVSLISYTPGGIS